MTTLVPKAQCTDEELRRQYPEGVKLVAVQVILRHGERTPVSERFENAGVPKDWAYCQAARNMVSVVKTAAGFSALTWARSMEVLGKDGFPSLLGGTVGDRAGICLPGQLTDEGRASTYALGERIRIHYVDRLGFMPTILNDTNLIYLRASPIPRALESVQQAFVGMYPSSTRPTSIIPAIVTRPSSEETIFPNDTACARFKEIFTAFNERAALRWNKTSEMAYLNEKIGKWMPHKTPTIAVDGHPRLSGILDHVMSTQAHGPDTKLPSEFYDKQVMENIEKICVEEWYQGYNESQELRMLGVGGLVGDVVRRMVNQVEHNQVGGEISSSDVKESSATATMPAKFLLAGAHDTTLGGFLASFGAFDNRWPPYTSHIAIELFKKADTPSTSTASSWWSSFPLFSFGSKPESTTESKSIAATPSSQLTPQELSRLDGYYVRVRYNDVPVTIPGCRAPGKHLKGNEGFCTLEEFKRIADKFTPKDWKTACKSNKGERSVPEKPEVSGY